jgi:hypothetical protein
LSYPLYETLPPPHRHTNTHTVSSHLAIRLVLVLFLPRIHAPTTSTSRRLPRPIPPAPCAKALHRETSFHHSGRRSRRLSTEFPALTTHTPSATPSSKTAAILLSGAGRGVLGPSSMYLSLADKLASLSQPVPALRLDYRLSRAQQVLRERCAGRDEGTCKISIRLTS